MIENREDPTVLDLMTDMRALEGVVTVRQTRPISDPVTNAGHRIIELNVSYIPKFIKSSSKLESVAKMIKSIEGVDMIKIIEHDNDIVNQKLQKRPIIL